MTPKKFGLYVHGQYVHTPQYFDIRSPFRSSDPLFPPELGQMSYLKKGEGDSEEIFAAVLAGARESFAQVERGFFPLSERIEFLRRLKQKISDHAFGMADVISREVAKPIALARAEVERALLTLEETISAAEAVLRPHPVETSTQKLWAPYAVHYQRQARGPVLAITPFNFPLNLVLHKLAPALAAGCPVLLKPSPKALLTALTLVDFCHACDLPAGMLCLIPCDNEMVMDFARDDSVATLSFTGSSRVGWSLKQALWQKPVFLELGGTAPAYIHRDTPSLPSVAQSLVQSALAFAGQSCISLQNLYVDQPIMEAFQALVVEAAQAARLAEPQNPAALLSCVIDEGSRRRLEDWSDEARLRPEQILFEGQDPLSADLKSSPTVLPLVTLQADKKSRLIREEVFGPVLNLFPVEGAEAFVREANAYSHRLQAAVFAGDPSLLRKVGDQLHYGGVVKNSPPSVRVDAAPYGGEGLAGVGREGPRWAMEDYCFTKTLSESRN